MAGTCGRARWPGKLASSLATPDPLWLTTLPADVLRRQVVSTTLAGILHGGILPPIMGVAKQAEFPMFVKSLNWPQEFASRVYMSPDDLPTLDGSTPVLVSTVMRFTREFRFFCLRNTPITWSPYSRGLEGMLDTQTSRGDERSLQRCLDWLTGLLPGLGLPNAVVVDVGITAYGGDPAIVEANPAWCSGIYQCDPAKVLDVLAGCVHA